MHIFLRSRYAFVWSFRNLMGNRVEFMFFSPAMPDARKTSALRVFQTTFSGIAWHERYRMAVTIVYSTA